MIDDQQCEWWACGRQAVSVTEFGGILLCKGHRMWADANRDTYGENGISGAEYGDRVAAARAVLAEDAA